MLSILQARLQEYMNDELPDVHTGFRKVEEPDIKFTISAWSKKQESSRKSSISALLTMPKPASWEIGMQVMKQQLEQDTSNRLVPNRKSSMSRLYIVILLI